MGSSSQSGGAMHMPVRLLFLFFVLWKVLLFIAILCSPGPGYDTSATLLKLTDTVPNNEADLLSSARSQNPPLFKLVRWDAIYYSQLSQRGHIFEQEWAFGVGLSRSVSFISTCKWIQGQALSFTDQTVISQFTGTSWFFQDLAIAFFLARFLSLFSVLFFY